MHAKIGNGPKGSMTNQIIDPQMHGKPMFVPRILSAEQPSLIASLFENVRDLLFPQKLPPLKVTSRPIPVRDIWEKKDPFFFQAEDGIRDLTVTGVQTCALPI